MGGCSSRCLKSLKKASLDLSTLSWGKGLKRVAAMKLQAVWEETKYLDPFQSGFQPGYRMETALVTLKDDLCWESGRVGGPCGFPWTFLWCSIPLTMVSSWRCWLSGDQEVSCLGSSALTHWWMPGDDTRGLLLSPVAFRLPVLQGSILSQMMFNFYTKILGEIIRGSGIRCTNMWKTPISTSP